MVVRDLTHTPTVRMKRLFEEVNQFALALYNASLFISSPDNVFYP